MTLDDRDQSVAALFADEVLRGDEPVLQRLGTRVSAVALDRWGRDLERDAGDQEWSAFEQVLEETAAEVLAHYDDGEADVDGVDARVFEGRPVPVGALAQAAEEIVDVIEEEMAGFDRHEPGGLVEPVEEGSA